MAVTIKLKNASGSDPSASDLVLGELAVRTDNGKIFLKKDDGNVAEVSGGGIDDGDKGDITVSSSGATWTIDADAVTYAKIQNVSATNRILGRDSSGAGVIEEISPSSLRTMINVEDGATADQSASEILTLLKTVDGSGSGLDADTLDGVQGSSYLRSDADDTAIGILSLTSSGQYPLTINGPHDGKIVVQGSSNPYIRFRESTTDKGFIQWNSGGFIEIYNEETAEGLKVSGGSNGLIFYEGGSDKTVYHAGNLSVGDGGLTQNNFTNTLKSKLDGIESGATADQSASEILTLIKTVDGAGSGLDADTLDTVSSGSFLRSDAADTATSDITFDGGAGAITLAEGSDISFTSGDWSGNHTKIQYHSSYLYIIGGSGGIIFREGGINRWILDGSGNLDPAADSTYDIGASGTRVANGYFDTLYGDGSNLTNLPSQTDNNFTTTLKNKLDGIAASATNVTNNNQLTNGAGYTTYTANQSLNTSSNPTFNDIYSNSWIRNNDSGEGVYNQATGQHWYSDSADYWNMGSGSNSGGIRFRDNHNQTIRGYVYYDNSNRIGFLDADGNWAVKVVKDVAVEFRVNDTIEATIEPDTFQIKGCFFENAQAVEANKTISNGFNAMSAGPITVNNSVTVTVGSGESWTII